MRGGVSIASTSRAALSRCQTGISAIRVHESALARLRRALEDDVDGLKASHERDIEGEMSVIFDEQEQYALDSLDQFRARLPTVERIFDFARWSRETAVRIGGYVREVFGSGFLFGTSQAGIDEAGPFPDALFNEFMRRMEESNGEISLTTRDDLAALVNRALSEGWSMDMLHDEIVDVFSRYRSSRARMIAITNVTPAFALAQLEAFRAAGISRSIWTTMQDERVRVTHGAANGQAAELFRRFRVGRSLLQYPGDPDGELREIINCRCFLRPEVA